jgi:TPR repeat protein
MNKAEHLKRLALNVMRRDINAMYDIGIKYRDGADLPQDSDLSVKWIKKSVKGGLEKAQLAVGKMYGKGDLIEQEYYRASIWYKKKPLRNNDIFQYKLGVMYYEGYGVRKDFLEASKWFFKSVDKGNSESQCQLGNMRKDGLGVRQDRDEALELFKKATNQRNGQAMYELGEMYFHGNITEIDPSTALLWYKYALKYGSGIVGRVLIDIYNDYKDELKNLEATKLFLSSHCDEDTKFHIYHCRMICYLKGLISKQDYAKAYYFAKAPVDKIIGGVGSTWLSTPAIPESDIDGNDLLNMYILVSEKGIDSLEYNVGYAYEFGLLGDYSYMTPVKVNISKAIEWYMAASKKGDVRADYRLGVIHEEENSIQRDTSVAVGFYTKAIKQENTNSMYRLANIYLRGKGVKQNLKKAYRLFSDAHNMGQCYSHLFLKIPKEFLNTNTAKGDWDAEAISEEDYQNELLYYSNENESNTLSFKMLEAVGHSGNIAV